MRLVYFQTDPVSVHFTLTLPKARETPSTFSANLNRRCGAWYSERLIEWWDHESNDPGRRVRRAALALDL